MIGDSNHECCTSNCRTFLASFLFKYQFIFLILWHKILFHQIQPGSICYNFPDWTHWHGLLVKCALFFAGSTGKKKNTMSSGSKTVSFSISKSSADHCNQLVEQITVNMFFLFSMFRATILIVRLLCLYGLCCTEDVKTIIMKIMCTLVALKEWMKLKPPFLSVSAPVMKTVWKNT